MARITIPTSNSFSMFSDNSFLTSTQQEPRSLQVHDILEVLPLNNAPEFARGFIENLHAIFKYSKDDILEFLVPDGMGDDAEQSCRERLQGVRQTLHAKLCEVFPAYTHSTLFNRRKVSEFAEDIFIIGYSIVNNQKDKRLSKTLKQAPNSQLPDSEYFETSVIAAPMATDLADLTSVCASLKVSVSQLTQTIKELKAQCLDLQKRIPLINSDSRESSSDQSGSQSNSEVGSTPESAHDTVHDIVPAVQEAQGTVRNNTLPDDTRQSSNTVVSDTTTAQNQTGSFRHSTITARIVLVHRGLMNE